MKDNPFAAYAAGVGPKSNHGDDGWMSARKDESDVRRSKAIAEEARRARRATNNKAPALADAGGRKANKAPGGGSSAKGRGKTGVGDGGGRRSGKKKADAFVVDDSDERWILDDDSDEDSISNDAARGGGKSFVALDDYGRHDGEFSDDPLSDTPRKSTRPSGGRTTSAFAGPDDYADDDDEARAISEAIKASMEEQRQKEGGGGKIRKRLRKNAASSSSSSSSLERIKPAPAAKVYKDDIEQLRDSDDDVDNAQLEDDEIEAYDPADEEEQTAAQVLAEANALSARIIRIVNGWYGAGGVGGGGGADDDGNSTNCERVKGLILGEDEGALCLGDRGGAGGEGGNVDNDETWISDETMKGILPNVKLAEYQLLGVNWMALLNRTKFGGGKMSKNVSGILADEMGLGKTVQTIAFLAWLNHQNKGGGDRGPSALSTSSRRPHLIVVPASVLSNWMNEFKKFAPDMIVYKYHGNQMEREQIRDEMDHNFVRGNDPLDVVLTTFSYFSSDSNKGDRSFLRKFNFDYLVVDEGHTLKNPKGLRYQNLNKFQTRSRLLLTGTPVQNSPKELMSLLCFLMPLFDRKTKSSKRKRGYDNDSDDDNDGGERMLEYFVQLEGGSDDSKAYRKLKQLFAPFVLRRKKEDVLSQILPPKTRQVDIVPMDEATQSAYNAIISSHVKARTEKGSGVDAQDAAAQKHLFTALWPTIHFFCATGSKAKKIRQLSPI
ncbi:hypothetical protein ACHAW5_007965 [Stephanodiscus triporus]|uniref:Helicase ATP-binding domain-containing protein n=1 Tax=Stephanodiscus triporus TaxID=2934178 RepID=A0ABD3MY40_9STRA